MIKGITEVIKIDLNRTITDQTEEITIATNKEDQTDTIKIMKLEVEETDIIIKTDPTDIIIKIDIIIRIDKALQNIIDENHMVTIDLKDLTETVWEKIEEVTIDLPIEDLRTTLIGQIVNLIINPEEMTNKILESESSVNKLTFQTNKVLTEESQIKPKAILTNFTLRSKTNSLTENKSFLILAKVINDNQASVEEDRAIDKAKETQNNSIDYNVYQKY